MAQFCVSPAGFGQRRGHRGRGVNSQCPRTSCSGCDVGLPDCLTACSTVVTVTRSARAVRRGHRIQRVIVEFGDGRTRSTRRPRRPGLLDRPPETLAIRDCSPVAAVVVPRWIEMDSRDNRAATNLVLLCIEHAYEIDSKRAGHSGERVFGTHKLMDSAGQPLSRLVSVHGRLVWGVLGVQPDDIFQRKAPDSCRTVAGVDQCLPVAISIALDEHVLAVVKQQVVPAWLFPRVGPPGTDAALGELLG